MCYVDTVLIAEDIVAHIINIIPPFETGSNKESWH